MGLYAESRYPSICRHKKAEQLRGITDGYWIITPQDCVLVVILARQAALLVTAVSIPIALNNSECNSANDIACRQLPVNFGK